MTDADVTISSVCSCSNGCNVIKKNQRHQQSRWCRPRIVNAFHEWQSFSKSSRPRLHEGQSVSSAALAHHLRVWLNLAQWRVLLGQIQDPPSGPTTRSKAPRSQCLFVLVRGTQSSSQRNPSLKWNISTGAFVALSDTNILSSVNNLSLYTTKPNSSCCLSIFPFLPCCIFHGLPPLRDPVASVSPFQPYFSFDFHAVHRTEISSTPFFFFFYSSMRSLLFWEWPVFCKRFSDLHHVGLERNHREELFRPAQTGSRKQVTALKHCCKCWICVRVCV